MTEWKRINLKLLSPACCFTPSGFFLLPFPHAVSVTSRGFAGVAVISRLKVTTRRAISFFKLADSPSVPNRAEALLSGPLVSPFTTRLATAMEPSATWTSTRCPCGLSAWVKLPHPEGTDQKQRNAWRLVRGIRVSSRSGAE